MSIFGDWVKQTNSYRQTFTTAAPFEHVVIPNFLNKNIAEQIIEEFPDPLDEQYDWKHYDNPIEQKFTLNDFSSLPIIKTVFDELQGNHAVDLISQITGIPQLESDPYFHGAGIHAYPRGGKLDRHLDYSIHPISLKERRVNLIIYLNPEWKHEYGGSLELWDEHGGSHTKVITPSWNTAVLFRTNNMSYHGLPTPIQCPQGEYRRSLAIYYVSPPTETAMPRFKAEFFPLEHQPVSSNLQRLYDIRKQRIITPNDLAHWPTWREDGHGYW